MYVMTGHGLRLVQYACAVTDGASARAKMMAAVILNSMARILLAAERSAQLCGALPQCLFALRQALLAVV